MLTKPFQPFFSLRSKLWPPASKNGKIFRGQCKCLAYHAVLKADGKSVEVEDDNLLGVLEEPPDVLDHDVDWPHREEVVVDPERIAGEQRYFGQH